MSRTAKQKDGAAPNTAIAACLAHDLTDIVFGQIRHRADRVLRQTESTRKRRWWRLSTGHDQHAVGVSYGTSDAPHAQDRCVVGIGWEIVKNQAPCSASAERGAQAGEDKAQCSRLEVPQIGKSPCGVLAAREKQSESCLSQAAAAVQP